MAEKKPPTYEYKIQVNRNESGWSFLTFMRNLFKTEEAATVEARKDSDRWNADPDDPGYWRFRVVRRQVGTWKVVKEIEIEE